MVATIITIFIKEMQGMEGEVELNKALKSLVEKFKHGTEKKTEEIYPLIEPFAYAVIYTEPETGKRYYEVVEPPLDNKEKDILDLISKLLFYELDVEYTGFESYEEKCEYIRNKVQEIVKKYKIKMSEESRSKILYYVEKDFVGLGKIEPLMRDDNVEDISCDGARIPLYIWHRKYESIPTNIYFESDEELDSFVIKLSQRCGKYISVAQPLLDASLPDGSRVQITFSKEVTMRGSTFTIRKFKRDPLTIIDLLKFGTLSSEMAAYYWLCIDNRMSVLIAGGVAAGKTTLLNSLAMFIRPDLKIVSIEDTPELNLPHEHWIQAVTRPGYGEKTITGERRGEISMFELLKAAVRQRPDYILVGEIRGEEAYVLFQAMATGHLGMATIHAEDMLAVIHRLESKPMNIPRSLLITLDIIAVQRKVRTKAGHTVRRNIKVHEIVGLEPSTNELLSNVVFEWDGADDTFQYTGRSYKVEEIMDLKGYSEDEIWDEINRRKAVLEWMVRKGIRRYVDVASVIRRYYGNPEKVYEVAIKELK